jgi:hypothetical protein
VEPGDIDVIVDRLGEAVDAAMGSMA